MSKLILGLTGNIGCGKSAVAAMLRRLGADFVDADLVVHGLLAAGTPTTAAIAARFGEQVIADDGAVDRRALAAIVFADTKALTDLEKLTHPAVRREIEQRIATATAPMVIEAIKLLESGLYILCDEVWVVKCDESVQLKRLIQDRGMLRADALQRIRAQSPQKAKIARADVVIDNSGSLDETWQQVEQAWRRFTNRS